jgi:hypothetical protein
MRLPSCWVARGLCSVWELLCLQNNSNVHRLCAGAEHHGIGMDPNTMLSQEGCDVGQIGCSIAPQLP